MKTKIYIVVRMEEFVTTIAVTASDKDEAIRKAREGKGQVIEKRGRHDTLSVVSLEEIANER